MNYCTNFKDFFFKSREIVSFVFDLNLEKTDIIMKPKGFKNEFNQWKKLEKNGTNTLDTKTGKMKYVHMYVVYNINLPNDRLDIQYSSLSGSI
jgi:hypothetical protein